MSSIVRKAYSFIYKTIFGELRYAKKLGVTFGKHCRLVGKVDFGSEPYLIQIGDHVSITTSIFVTHDGGVWVMRGTHPKLDVIAPIKIGNNVFIGTGCIILPGTIIGDDVVIGAGSVVKGIIDSESIYAGIPARKVKGLSDYKEQCLSQGLHLKGEVNKKNLLCEMFNQ